MGQDSGQSKLPLLRSSPVSYTPAASGSVNRCDAMRSRRAAAIGDRPSLRHNEQNSIFPAPSALENNVSSSVDHGGLQSSLAGLRRLREVTQVRFPNLIQAVRSHDKPSWPRAMPVRTVGRNAKTVREKHDATRRRSNRWWDLTSRPFLRDYVGTLESVRRLHEHVHSSVAPQS
jgi:hypothetical protein